jgi:hypothetical protein
MTNQAEVQAKERRSMNEDAIAALSAQVMKLMTEVQELKNEKKTSASKCSNT